MSNDRNSNQFILCISKSNSYVAGADSTLCLGTNGTLHAQASSGTAPYTYTWNNGVTGQTQVISPAVNTTYTVTVTDAKGCVSVASDNTQFNLYPALTTNFVTPAAICPGTVVPLSVNVVTGQPAYSYSWSNNGTVFANIGNVTVSPQFTTAYTVVTTDQCTSVTDIINVSVFTVPTVTLTSNVTNGCAPLTVNLTPSVPTSQLGGSCTWTFSDGTILNGCGAVSAVFNNPGCYDAIFTSTSLDGCPISASTASLFCIAPDPIADFLIGNLEPTYLNTQVPLYDQSIDADTYAWNFGQYGTSNINNPVLNINAAEVGDTITVCQTVISVYGCTDTICKEIIFAEEFAIYVPNTFTPDGNSVNQTFGPVFPPTLELSEYELLIFNRWGEVVFESHDPAIGWNGKYAQFEAQDDVYTWKIHLRHKSKLDKEYQFVGHVNLLR